MPAALDLLRSHREAPETPHAVVLAATDPANPYGTLLKWPDAAAGARHAHPPTSAAARRAPSARWWCSWTVWPPATCVAASAICCVALPDAEPARTRVAQALARALIQLALSRVEGQRGLFLETINGVRAGLHPAARWFVAEGFVVGADGLQYRAPRSRPGRRGRRPVAPRTRPDARGRHHPSRGAHAAHRAAAASASNGSSRCSRT